MKLRGLIDLCLILCLTSNSNGQIWSINVTTHINATLGASMTIPCTFTYPKKHHTKDVQVYWKKPGKTKIKTSDNDKNQFVFHTNSTFVIEKYRGKTNLIGDKANGDCSLKIVNIMENEPKIYVRLVAKDQNYSFVNKPVSIFVSGAESINLGQGVTSPPLFTFEPTHIVTTLQTSYMYAAIFAPLLALLIITVVAAIFCHVRRKRSHSVTRVESGYYENFSGASSNQAKREASCENHENKKLSELKVIDDPIYVNTEELTGHTDESTDQTHNVYGNVDYSK
ncbi:uncharacterized protein LOC118300591 isoform X2 [Scophthalmus maximus]|nr:uncharacterized protein LOC118300591 isoform X2 [Scophthalmus maximus]